MLASKVALKEWAVVVEAIESGDQMILVRKGGIRDPKGAFQLERREFLLYPTWEHQAEGTEKKIRPEFCQRYSQIVSQPSHPETVSLTVYAGLAFCGEIRDPARLAGLERYHIYTPQFFEDRMRYRPQAPTLVVLLRAYRLPKPVDHPVKPEYAGCKSWVPLAEAIPIEGAQPVVDNRRFRQALEEIAARLG